MLFLSKCIYVETEFEKINSFIHRPKEVIKFVKAQLPDVKVPKWIAMVIVYNQINPFY